MKWLLAQHRKASFNGENLTGPFAIKNDRGGYLSCHVLMAMLPHQMDAKVFG